LYFVAWKFLDKQGNGSSLISGKVSNLGSKQQREGSILSDAVKPRKFGSFLKLITRESKEELTPSSTADNKPKIRLPELKPCLDPDDEDGSGQIIS